MKRIFLDMDGVLANWEKAANSVLGRERRDPNDFTWEELHIKAPMLYADLELMPDALKLWSHVTNSSNVASVQILTAIPRRMHWPDCTKHKREWVWNKLGSVDVLFGPFAWDKQFHCKDIDDILIDDSELNVPQWRSKGGIAILHTSADDTIEVLKMLGV